MNMKYLCIFKSLAQYFNEYTQHKLSIVDINSCTPFMSHTADALFCFVSPESISDTRVHLEPMVKLPRLQLSLWLKHIVTQKYLHYHATLLGLSF